jgi:hypothetical protein
VHVHTAIDLFGNFARQIGAADTRIDRSYAETGTLRVHLLADSHHESGAVVAHDLRLIGLAENAAHGGVQHRRELIVGTFDCADRLVEAQRIDDPVAHKRVDFDTLIVGSEHFLFWAFQIENTVVEENDGLDERYLEVQARFGDEPASGDRLAETQNQRLLCLLHLESGAADDDQHHNRDADEHKCESVSHRRAPVGWGVLFNSSSGRYGTTPCPFG